MKKTVAPWLHVFFAVSFVGVLAVPPRAALARLSGSASEDDRVDRRRLGDDVIMRTAAAQLQQRVGQPSWSRTWAALRASWGQACKQAAPDGYTICIIYHSTMV